MPITGPDSNPKTRVGGQNKLPLHLIPPRALAHVALAFADGGFKYQPYNWRDEPISSSVYYGAAKRHLDAWWEGENIAPDGVAHHLAHAICCMLMILDTMDSAYLNDNRPARIGKSYSALLDELAAHLPALRERENTKFDLHDIATGPNAPVEEPIYQAAEPVYLGNQPVPRDTPSYWQICAARTYPQSNLRCQLLRDHSGPHSFGGTW